MPRKALLFRLLLVTLFFLFSCGSRAPKIFPFGEDFTRAKVVSENLKDDEHKGIEGIWLAEAGDYEVAIVKNTSPYYPQYQLIGVLTKEYSKYWKNGEVKLLIKKTADPSIYKGVFIGYDRRRLELTLVQRHPNILDISMPWREPSLIRNYPIVGEEDADVIKGTGTAFFVSSTILATCAHVVEKAKTVDLSIDGKLVNAQVLILDKKNDLALLKISAPFLPARKQEGQAVVQCLSIGDSQAVGEGEPIYTMGYPLSSLLGDQISVSQGIVSKTTGPKDDPRQFQISAPIQPGSSGSPVLNGMGRVVGVVDSSLSDAYMLEKTGATAQSVNFAVRVDYLKSLLALVPDSECPPQLTAASPVMDKKSIQEVYNKLIVKVSVR